jgi:hypothetical protein
MTIKTDEIGPISKVRMAAAARKRVHRARIRRGEKIFRVLAKAADVVATLRSVGRLGEEDNGNHDSVEKAFNCWIADLIQETVTRSIGNR